MSQRNLIIVSIAIGAIFAVIIYEPVAIVVFKFREPYFDCPIKGGKDIAIRNDTGGDGEFGAKRRNGRSHSGIDIMADVGKPVYASKSGLAFFGNVPTGYGKYVMIYHPDGYQTIYGHLSDWNGRAVRKVSKGEVIGFAGKTGNASGRHIQSHLHFEIRKDGEAQDPERLMKMGH